MVLGPINQVSTPCSSVPNPKMVWEYERPPLKKKRWPTRHLTLHSSSFLDWSQVSQITLFCVPIFEKILKVKIGLWHIYIYEISSSYTLFEPLIPLDPIMCKTILLSQFNFLKYALFVSPIHSLSFFSLSSLNYELLTLLVFPLPLHLLLHYL